MAGVEVLKWASTEDRPFNGIPADDAVDSWYFMSSPFPVAAIVLFYLYFVISLGPKLMERRKPFNLKYVLVLYNLYQVVFSIYLCSELLFDQRAFKYFLKYACVPLERQENVLIAKLNTASWYYFFSKMVELLDTVFFILRKKQRQVTVLHVWHHTNMVVSTWAYLKYIRGEQAFLPGFINCCVHVVMYSYYLLAACGPSIKKYLWWKQYITKLQLGQFVIILFYLTALIVFDCSLPRGLTIYMAVNVVIFLVLFLNFYYKAYFKDAPNIKHESKKTN